MAKEENHGTRPMAILRTLGSLRGARAAHVSQPSRGERVHSMIRSYRRSRQGE